MDLETRVNELAALCLHEAPNPVKAYLNHLAPMYGFCSELLVDAYRGTTKRSPRKWKGAMTQKRGFSSQGTKLQKSGQRHASEKDV